MTEPEAGERVQQVRLQVRSAPAVEPQVAPDLVACLRVGSAQASTAVSSAKRPYSPRSAAAATGSAFSPSQSCAADVGRRRVSSASAITVTVGTMWSFRSW